MRAFITGSTGYMGSAVVKELLSAGHQVLGLTRTDKGADELRSQGAEAMVGTIEDLELLKKATSECDAVIHLAFNFNMTDFAGSCAMDRAAITAMGSVLAAAGGERALVISSAAVLLQHGKLGDEDQAPDTTNPLALRGSSELVCHEFAKKGVRTSVVRLPPSTHGPGNSGLLTPYLAVALRTGVVAYVDGGQNRWCAGHRDDAAKLYRLAMENGKAGCNYHAVAEEAVTMKDIAAEAGKHLNMPVISVSKEKASEHFGNFEFVALVDNTVSSEKTRERLGWNPTGPTLLEDMAVIVDYAKSHADEYAQLGF